MKGALQAIKKDNPEVYKAVFGPAAAAYAKGPEAAGQWLKTAGTVAGDALNLGITEGYKRFVGMFAKRKGLSKLGGPLGMLLSAGTALAKGGGKPRSLGEAAAAFATAGIGEAAAIGLGVGRRRGHRHRPGCAGRALGPLRDDEGPGHGA